MFVVLDTNHFTEFTDGSMPGRKLLRRLDRNKADVFTCTVGVEETTRGWLALLNQSRPGEASYIAMPCFIGALKP